MDTCTCSYVSVLCGVAKILVPDNLVDRILTSKRVEQQTYKGCMALLKLADKYSIERLEAACEKAPTYAATPSYKSIKNILIAGQDKSVKEPKETTKQNKYSITRGGDYYRR